MRRIEVVFRNKYHLVFAALSSIIFAIFYVYTQVLGNLANIDIWLSTAPVVNLALFAIFSILLGITISFQVFNFRSPKTCSVAKKSAAPGSAAAFLGLLVAQCPACASLGALILPISLFPFFVKYSTILNLISIGLMFFTITYLGGFQKVDNKSLSSK